LPTHGLIEALESAVDAWEAHDSIAHSINKISPFISLLNWPSLVSLLSSTTTIYAADPNDMLGPTGYGDAAYIPSDSTVAYEVRFENKPDATGPARQIVVTDTLDPNLDLDTFQLSEITFANQAITVPPGLDHYETTVPMNANGTNILVDVQAALDRDTRTLTLTLRAIDQTTGWIPEDPTIGLLYPDDVTGRGQGSISYSAAPLAGLPSGTVINNRASIVFDYNDAIATPLAHNTLDAAAPTSHVLPLPAVQTDTTFTVQWAGQDEAGGSGIAGYDVYVSVDGGPYALLVGDTTDNSTTVVGQPGHTYAFYSVATDNVGHVEANPADAQTTTLPGNAPTSSVDPLPAVTTTTDFLITWSGSPGTGASRIASYDVFVSTDDGPFLPFLLGTTQTSATFSGAFGHRYGFASIATDDLGNRQPDPAGAQASTQVLAATAVTLTSSAANNTSTYGQLVTFTATVTTSSSDAGTPTGTVSFYNGSTFLGRGTLDGNGQATFTTSALPVGQDTIAAVYDDANDSGGTLNPNFASSSGELTQTITDSSGRSDVTSQLDIQRSGLFYNRRDHLFYGGITLTNISNSAIAGSLVVQLQGLTAGVTLQYAAVTLAGQTYQLPVDNSDPSNPTITLSQLLLAALAPGQSLALSLRFSDPAFAMIDFATKVFSDP
jgi:hypothetical protein